MKATARDYFSIVAAILAIFVCGYGIGFLFGERQGQRQVSAPRPPSTTEEWEVMTLSTIQKWIEISPEQLPEIKREIEASSETIRNTRQEALRAYREELAALHERLRDHLTAEQWERLQSAAPDAR